ncbi:MAG: hypothetical protein ACD_34C00125G0001 [uncultured bacterium]|nr:MAG: hypothetical protein ACD_34C00125G0001 [uncultured bacterium]
MCKTYQSLVAITAFQGVKPGNRNKLKLLREKKLLSSLINKVTIEIFYALLVASKNAICVQYDAFYPPKSIFICAY